MENFRILIGLISLLVLGMSLDATAQVPSAGGPQQVLPSGPINGSSGIDPFTGLRTPKKPRPFPLRPRSISTINCHGSEPVPITGYYDPNLWPPHINDVNLDMWPSTWSAGASYQNRITARGGNPNAPGPWDPWVCIDVKAKAK